jgi:HSP20 family protein
MALVRAWDPWGEVRRLSEEMSRLFEGGSVLSREFPPLNITRSQDQVVAEALAPGLDSERLEVTAVGDTLTIRGATMNNQQLSAETPKEGSLRESGRETEYVVPAVDIYETEKEYVLLADLPGVRPDGLDVHVERERLTIRGRPSVEDQPKAQYREFALREYYRSFTLAGEIDSEYIRAELRDGVLRLVLPKSSRAQVRRVPVTH